MNLAILVGIPNAYVHRLKACIRSGSAHYRAGWDVQFVSTGHGRPQIGHSELQSALRKAETTTASHVIGLSSQDGSIRKGIANQIRPYFRFAWLDNALLSNVPHRMPELVAGLNDLLEQEEIWADLVRPSRPDCPLLLPGCSFTTSCRQLWPQAELFGDTQMIRVAARSIEEFRAQHWRPTAAGPRRWTDDRSLIFDHSGPRHGRAPFPRSWKYSYYIPDLQYDVTSARAREFAFRDAFDSFYRIAQGNHLNVDAHGHVI